MIKRNPIAAVCLVFLAGCANTAQQVDAKQTDQPTLPAVTQPESVVATQVLQSMPDAKGLFDQGMREKAAGEFQRMIEHLMAAAEAGSADAHYELARLLSEGKIVVQDKAAARLYLERSAQLGNSEALRVMAWNSLRGDGVAADKALGERMMKQAAGSSVRAQRELGMLYANIYQPHLSSYEQADHYLTLAAQAGDAEAAYSLGRLKEGSGDTLGAIEWYEAASQKGFAKARSAMNALKNGTESNAPRVDPKGPGTGQYQTLAVDPEQLYQRAMQLLESRGNGGQEQEADAYALLVLASEGGHQLAAQEIAFQGGIKQQLDAASPGWLEAAKQRVLKGQGA